ncbi:MAG: hypothetical protein V2A73_04945, partial [Pseudomonadota bacterium]
PVELAVIDPHGGRTTLKTDRLGGPPFSYVAAVPNPMPGRWRAVVGDGTRVLACQTISVGRHRSPSKSPCRGVTPSAGNSATALPCPVWLPRRRGWSKSTENLYSAFVERLFDDPADPVDQETTWPNLQALLRDPRRNLLLDHLGSNEDAVLELEPDCADLPYALRAYFAWKLRLPFGYLACHRNRSGRPPTCSALSGGSSLDDPAFEQRSAGNETPRKAGSEATAFNSFVKDRLFRAVSSANGRTSPDDSTTDFYPVPLSRGALRPGTVFADPYGHLLIVAAWVNQGLAKPGLLIGAEAQPDGTIGRRRFWRGSFLFDPDTSRGGAGFKAYRPWLLEEEEMAQDSAGPILANAPPRRANRAGRRTRRCHSPASCIRQSKRLMTVFVPNNELDGLRNAWPLSRQQYLGTVSDFYETIERLINPRPLKTTTVLLSLVDALHEAVARRVISVANAERHAATATMPMAMPVGSAIFQTSGPWEDYSTPSRDLRLLIAIDTVLGFPATVGRTPDRFGLSPSGLAQIVADLEQLLIDELRKRSIAYVRSDGSTFRLSLEEIVDRRAGFEIAYNPNDCVEVRWVAPLASQEIATCRRRAPPEQMARMEEYRPWFATRQRPRE